MSLNKNQPKKLPNRKAVRLSLDSRISTEQLQQQYFFNQRGEQQTLGGNQGIN